MSYIGANKIGGMHLGSTTIAKAYLGSDLVYQKSGVTPSLPYDAEIEYLQSSGTQYITIPIIPDDTTGMEVDFRKTNTKDVYICGMSTSVKNTRFSIGQGSSWKPYYGWGNYYMGSYAINERVLARLNLYNSREFYYEGNGQSQTMTIQSTLSFIPTVEIRLFGSNGITGLFSGKIYYFKVTKGSSLVFDAIPVRVGQVGYMYDKISRTLFGNDGTGSFTYGNDVN